MFNQHDQKARDIKWEFEHFLEKLEQDYKIKFKEPEGIMVLKFLNTIREYEGIKE